MELKNFSPGDKVELIAKEKTWTGYILESHDPEIILLKLASGYNIGIREYEINSAKLLAKNSAQKTIHKDQSNQPGLKNVAIVITGGTISSKLDPKTGGVVPTTIDSILEIAPQIRKICNISKVVSPFMKFSEDLDASDWKRIAKICHELLLDHSIDGIILTHGTDTLHYTAAALSFFISGNNKPIAITYSQRSIDRGSTDAALNLLCAAHFASSNCTEIAIIGHENENDETCIAIPATKARKMHTSRRDAFKAVNTQPLARITADKIEFLQEYTPRNNAKPILDAKFSDSVTLLHVYPGMDPSIIDWHVKKGYKGIILAGTGLGHVPSKNARKNLIPSIKKALEKGVIIAITPQTIFGRLQPYVYSSGRELQKTSIVFLEDMLPETAFVKLGWILAHPKWHNSIKEKLLENISREFSSRLLE